MHLFEQLHTEQKETPMNSFNRNRSRSSVWSIALLVGALLSMIGCNGVNTIGGPKIAGTYRLMSRELPDGTIQRPPAVEGMISFTRDYRNFNVCWTDAKGKRQSISSIARYKLSDGVYSETNMCYIVNGAEGISYDMTPASGSAPTAHADRRLEFQMPLHNEPTVVFDNDGFTATRPGEFIDRWERVN
jgi:hypothetical protein